MYLGGVPLWLRAQIEKREEGAPNLEGAQESSLLPSLLFSLQFCLEFLRASYKRSTELEKGESGAGRQVP